MSWKIF